MISPEYTTRSAQGAERNVGFEAEEHRITCQQCTLIYFESWAKFKYVLEDENEGISDDT